ncbi:MAG: hypothetical protein ACKVK1_01920 [Flavobacteriales bacterium]
MIAECEDEQEEEDEVTHDELTEMISEEDEVTIDDDDEDITFEL